MKRVVTVILAIACVGASWASAQQRTDRRSWGRSSSGSSGSTTSPSSRPATGDEYADRFAVIAERNMFLKDRVPPVQPNRNQSTAPVRPPPSAEASIILRGMVIDDADSVLRAYFEDTRSNTLIRVSAGDALAKTHVVDVTIDAVQLQTDTGLVWIRVGENLLGTVVQSAPTFVSTSAGPTTAPTSQPGEGGGDSDVLARMRERAKQRQQQQR
ncbi:MAG: hypothetical protein QM770_16035 [Tepidisphaeraceae bacterium]